MNYLLDTNIALIYLRNNQASRKLANTLNFFSIDTNLLISVVSIGELKSIAKQNRWREKRMNALLEWLDTFVVLDINIEEIVERYAEIDAFSQGKLEGKTNSFSSRNMGKNDIWIAATASIYNLQLVTTDKDFNHLEHEYLNLKLIDLNFI